MGAMVYGDTTTSVRLYPKLALSLDAPAVGTHGVLQGETYSVRLTFGSKTSTYDLLDEQRMAVASRVSIRSPKPADKSKPHTGAPYFGSFTGGASDDECLVGPVFLTVSPSDLAGAGSDGTMTLDTQTSGTPAYRLQVTDSSVFVYTNINIDTREVGSVSTSNVFLANAVINSSPDDTSSKAFAPCKVMMGLVRPALIGSRSNTSSSPRTTASSSATRATW